MQLLESLRAQFSDTQDQIRALTDEINANDGAHPTDEQSANLLTLNDGLESLVPRIEQATGMAQRMHGAAELLGGVPGNLDATLAGVRRQPVGREWESFGAYARALAGGEVDETTRDGIAHMVGTIEHARAFVDMTTPDVPGLIPPQWLRDIIGMVGTARPFISAFDTRPLPPTGMSINYPSITARPQVGKQATEKTDIASAKSGVVAGVANVLTYGGGEDISVQVLQRTDPAYLTLVLELYAEEMAAAMDLAAIGVAGNAIAAGNRLTISAAAGNADITAKFTEAAGLIFAANGVPNAAVLGLGAWQAIAGAVDSDGRPLFPNASPMNPAGSSSLSSQSGDVRGWNFVVDGNMATDVAIVGWSQAFTSMVSGIQTLSADNPSKLGRDYAVFEFAAFAARKPDALVQITFGA